MEKAPIKKFAMEARRKLMDDVRSQLGRYGITANGILDPHTVTENELIIDLGNGSSQRVRGKQAIAQYRNLVAKAREFFTADKPQQAIDNFCEAEHRLSCLVREGRRRMAAWPRVFEVI